MGGLECVITGLMDEFRDFFRRFRISREIFTGVVVFFSFFVALSCVTPVQFCVKA
jgi:solute carrier family 6 noradrenalin transporter-like protein 2